MRLGKFATQMTQMTQKANVTQTIPTQLTPTQLYCQLCYYIALYNRTYVVAYLLPSKIQIVKISG